MCVAVNNRQSLYAHLHSSRDLMLRSADLEYMEPPPPPRARLFRNDEALTLTVEEESAAKAPPIVLEEQFLNTDELI
jgi:hypothetical protein